MASGNRLLGGARSERQKGNGHERQEEKFCLNIKKIGEETVVKGQAAHRFSPALRKMLDVRAPELPSSLNFLEFCKVLSNWYFGAGTQVVSTLLRHPDDF